jgi:hypothetical protein
VIGLIQKSAVLRTISHNVSWTRLIFTPKMGVVFSSETSVDPLHYNVITQKTAVYKVIFVATFSVVAVLNDPYFVCIYHWRLAPNALCFPAGPPFSLMPACSHCVRNTPYRRLGQRPSRKASVAYWLRQIRLLSHWRQECFVLSIVPLKNDSAFIVSKERKKERKTSTHTAPWAYYYD